jgi:hypothetical protein
VRREKREREKRRREWMDLVHDSRANSTHILLEIHLSQIWYLEYTYSPKKISGKQKKYWALAQCYIKSISKPNAIHTIRSARGFSR